MREIRTTSYDSRTYTDENLLYKNKIIDTVRLSRSLTWLYGMNSQKFPLLMSTEGQGAYKSVKPKKLNDTQYVWSTIGRMKYTSTVVGLVNTSDTAPGLNYAPIKVYMRDNWFPAYYGAFSPDGDYQVRVQGEPIRIGADKWEYTFAPMFSSPDSYIPVANFLEGRTWAMTATSIAASKSDGTRSNTMAPGEWTNQFGFHRFSKQIAGNVANKVVNLELALDGGGKTNMWMPFEMKLWEIERRELTEQDLWYSEYNRDAYGQIHLKDDETGEPIPKGAGIKQIIKTFGNYDTYGSTLTISKFENIINRIMSNRVDDTPMEIVLYTGAGGKRMFHEALMNDASAKLFYQRVGDLTVNGKNGYMQYGNYFDQYKTIDGKVISVTEVNLFNHGVLADLDRKEGRMLNGFPWQSYNMVFLDHSLNTDGERNIQLVCEEGREVITGVYKGMSPLPGSWGAIPGNLLSTRKDIASYEIITSQGINMLNGTTSFWLEYDG